MRKFKLLKEMQKGLFYKVNNQYKQDFVMVKL